MQIQIDREIKRLIEQLENYGYKIFFENILDEHLGNITIVTPEGERYKVPIKRLKEELLNLLHNQLAKKTTPWYYYQAIDWEDAFSGHIYYNEKEKKYDWRFLDIDKKPILDKRLPQISYEQLKIKIIAHLFLNFFIRQILVDNKLKISELLKENVPDENKIRRAVYLAVADMIDLLCFSNKLLGAYINALNNISYFDPVEKEYLKEGWIDIKKILEDVLLPLEYKTISWENHTHFVKTLLYKMFAAYYNLLNRDSNYIEKVIETPTKSEINYIVRLELKSEQPIYEKMIGLNYFILLFFDIVHLLKFNTESKIKEILDYNLPLAFLNKINKLSAMRELFKLTIENFIYLNLIEEYEESSAQKLASEITNIILKTLADILEILDVCFYFGRNISEFEKDIEEKIKEILKEEHTKDTKLLKLVKSESIIKKVVNYFKKHPLDIFMIYFVVACILKMLGAPEVYDSTIQPIQNYVSPLITDILNKTIGNEKIGELDIIKSIPGLAEWIMISYLFSRTYDFAKNIINKIKNKNNVQKNP